MKWTLNELLQTNGQVEFDEEIKIDSSLFQNNSRINAVQDVHVSGSGYLDENDNRFYCHIVIDGTMICPDAITGEEIEVPFSTDSDEVYVFEETDEDGARVVTDEVIELLPAVVDAIWLEVPLQATEAEEGNYPEGEGWKVYSEAEYQKSQEDQLDPRLAVLKQFKNE